MLAGSETVTDDSAKLSASLGVRNLITLLSFAQLLLGEFGFYGLYKYFEEPVSNASRYQFLFIPYMNFMCAISLLIATALLYRRWWSSMTATERWIVNLGCLLPLLAIAGAILQ